MFSVAPPPFDAREPEFKAVVLAMPEDGMDLLSERDNTSHALLPIANKPMLWYVLQWLEQGGILDIIIVTTRESKTDIGSYIEVYEGLGRITVKGLDDVSGTADALRQVASLIKSNVVVVPCDLVVDVPAAHFIDLVRIKQPAFAAMFCEAMRSEGGGGSAKAKAREAPLCVGVDQPSSRLVLLQRMDGTSEDLALPMPLVRRFPSMALSDKMHDVHLYVLQRWVLSYIAANPKIESLQDDLLPLFVRAQSQRQLLESRDIRRHIPAPAARCTGAYGAGAQLGQPDRAAHGEPDAGDQLSVFAYVRRGGIVGRANQIPQYCDLNSIVSRMMTGARTASSAKLALQTQVGSDSLVGVSSQLGERCSVKRSVVGAHCVIGKDVKIVNSVIMDHVTIGDGVKLESCVVCKLASIGGNAQLKSCEVGASMTVPAGSNLKNTPVTEDTDTYFDDGGVYTEFA
ncbi:Translation initiation factor eIF-2B subunit gamma [Coemansia helicoidea]|uniref:Translation initiation factor eIF-2B subunit gamma n=1 Tax=Coemansia helicoidea TaxID=1286919 RepID=A0ACC1L9N5_9FUNG|nr:Translation initiation factor eIF-2B subunit gamma [Coemansia helicoidea]